MSNRKGAKAQVNNRQRWNGSKKVAWDESIGDVSSQMSDRTPTAKDSVKYSSSYCPTNETDHLNNKADAALTKEQQESANEVTHLQNYYQKKTRTLIPDHRMEVLTAYVDAGDLVVSIKDTVNAYREHLYIHGKVPFTVAPHKEYIPIIIKQYVEVDYASELELALKGMYERDAYITRIRNCWYHECPAHLRNMIDYMDKRTDNYWTEYRGLMKWVEGKRNGQ